MRSLFGFGDSYTQGHLLNKDFPPFIQWKNYIGKDLPPTWIDLLGSKLEMDELFAEAEGAWFIPDGEGQKILTQIKRRTYDRSHPE